MNDNDSGDNKGRPMRMRSGGGSGGPGGGSGGPGGPGGPSRVRQSFSHGRTKPVVVEKKRKRIVLNTPGSAGGGEAESVETTVAVGVREAPREAAAAPRPAAPPPAATTASATPARPVQKPVQKPVIHGPGAPQPQAQRDMRPAPQKPRGAMLKSLSDEEYARRLEALKQAKKDEEVRRRREAEEAARRAEEDKKRRAEEEAAAALRAAEEARLAAERAAIEATQPRPAVQPEPAAPRADARPEPRPEGRPEGRSETRSEPRSGPRAAPRAGSAAAAVVVPPAEPVEARPGARGKVAPASPRSADLADRDEGRKSGAAAPKKAAPTPKKGVDERRRSGKLTITQATGDGEGGRQRSLAAMRRRQERDKRRLMGSAEREKVVRDVRIPDALTVQELANRMAERVADVIKALMKMGVMATQNQPIDADTAELIVGDFGHRFTRVSESDVENVIETAQDADEHLEPRAPIVTIMGHVDHGKTSLLDAIRKTNVVSGEAGGITQHIGAYQVTIPSGAKITFLDTPGHAAFTSMRARGAQVTDIVILVVAADDSVMPQTVEAISHAKAARVPMIVAINKCDKPSANPAKVRQQLLQHEVMVEEMGGETLDVEVSAVTRKGLDSLLENIALQAELLDLKANPDRPAEGAVIEAKLDVGRGPVATVLVQRGTLRTGDIFVVGEQWGRVRALVDDTGERITEAGPSVPVEVLGLNGTPEAGDVLNVVEDEAKAREIADYRQRKTREKAAATGGRTTLDQLLAQARSVGGPAAELPLVVKTDVQGSAEAIVQALEKLSTEEVRIRILHSGVGAITESDVNLAEASKAPIIGFNVRANAPAREAANQKGVEIRYYSIIYNLVDDVKAAASGLLKPEMRETFIGYARIKQVFKVSGAGKVAGCVVTEGVARRSAGVRLLRDNVVIHEGKLKTLKRFKDEVKEVNAGQECGMAFENYEDIREEDVIEIFETEEITRTL